MRVYVLLFNARTENEGIHTLKAGDRDVILMFESEDDATRFGLMLEAQDFANPTVEALESEEIEEFCQDAGYDCKLIPEGTLTVPPETNVEQTDWDPNAEPQPDRASDRSTDSPSELSSTELDDIRRRLEGLL
ncbi:DUF3110 domain-containing protein [Egbenema bharatensis]|uniref:DUF3110 domain-containing protein n=1 Tax=Egbenema bharatensis TaxID=3463334 RepID=UPI003A8C5D8F